MFYWLVAPKNSPHSNQIGTRMSLHLKSIIKPLDSLAASVIASRPTSQLTAPNCQRFVI